MIGILRFLWSKLWPLPTPDSSPKVLPTGNTTPLGYGIPVLKYPDGVLPPSAGFPVVKAVFWVQVVFPPSSLATAVNLPQPLRNTVFELSAQATPNLEIGRAHV